MKGGNTTSMGCLDTRLIDLFGAATFGADRWGRTPTGNLVLTNSTVVVEFELTEEMPAGSLQGVSAPLNTIWNSEAVGDYDNFDTETAPASLTFTIDENGSYIAVLVVEECGELGFRATFEDVSEGRISFEGMNEPQVDLSCDISDIAIRSRSALARADYFAAAYGGVQLWDGPTPLAIFADE